MPGQSSEFVGSQSSNVNMEDNDNDPGTSHARALERVVEKILKNVMADTPDTAKFSPADTLDVVRIHAEDDIKDLITAHARFEQLFSRTRLIYSHQHPEKVLEAKIRDMKKALQRKEALINRHHQNLTKWQSILQNGVPPPTDPVNELVPGVQTTVNRPPAPDIPARSTPAPRQSPAAVERAPSTPITVTSPAAATLPPQQPQPQQPQLQPPVYQTPTQPAPAPYPHPVGQQFPQQPAVGMQQPTYHRQPVPQQLQRPQGVPTPPYGSAMTRAAQPMAGVGYQQQQQPGMGGYGVAPRQGVSPLSAMLQAGPNPLLQQQMRVPSPNAPIPPGGGGGVGGYGQNVSPRMVGGQWRPQMQQQMGQLMQSGYGTDDVTLTYPQQQQMHPQQHPGAGGGPPTGQ